MADVLSQSQIDMLLKSMQAGAEEEKPEEKPKEEKQYKKYDFYSPKKFTRDRLKILKTIHDNYCRIITSQLNGILRMSCEIEVMSVEEQHYYEFSNLLNENDVMEIITVRLPDESRNPPLLFHIDQSLMVNMIDRLLGGEGDDTEVDASYTYTEIELALYRKLIEYFSSGIRDSWKNYLRVDVKDMRLEESPSMFQEIGPDEAVVIIMLNMTMSYTSGYVSICMPGSLVTNIFTLIEKHRHVEDAYDNGVENGREIIMEKLRASALNMKVRLGTAQMSFKDIYRLKVNDVIDLRKSSDSDVTVYVDEEPWFKGRMGVHKSNVAVRLEERLEDEETQENKEAEQTEQFEEQVPAQ